MIFQMSNDSKIEIEELYDLVCQSWEDLMSYYTVHSVTSYQLADDNLLSYLKNRGQEYFFLQEKIQSLLSSQDPQSIVIVLSFYNDEEGKAEADKINSELKCQLPPNLLPFQSMIKAVAITRPPPILL